MYAVDHDDSDSSNRSYVRRKLRSNSTTLKCFILTPSAQYVNPMFAHVLSSSTFTEHTSPQHNDSPSSTLMASAVDSRRSIDRRSPTSSTNVVFGDLAASPPSSPSLSNNRSPTTGSTVLSWSPSVSLMTNRLLPTPPHSSTIATNTPSTMASSSSPDTYASSSWHSYYHRLSELSPSPLHGSPFSHYSARTAHSDTANAAAMDHSSNSTPCSSVSRYDSSLTVLAKKFIRILSTSPNGKADLNMISNELGVPKRRMYDISNVLEGIGLLIKGGKCSVQWKNHPANKNSSTTTIDGDLEELKSKEPVDLATTQKIEQLRQELEVLDQEDRQLGQMMEHLEFQGRHYAVPSSPANLTITGTSLSALTKWLYVRYSDITGLAYYGSDNLIGIKAPVGTDLHVPDAEAGMPPGMRKYCIYLNSKAREKLPLSGQRHPSSREIKLHLVRPEVSPTNDSGDSRSDPCNSAETTKPPPKSGSYVAHDLPIDNSDGASTQEERSDVASRAPKRPYAESLNHPAGYNASSTYSASAPPYAPYYQEAQYAGSYPYPPYHPSYPYPVEYYPSVHPGQDEPVAAARVTPEDVKSRSNPPRPRVSMSGSEQTHSPPPKRSRKDPPSSQTGPSEHQESVHATPVKTRKAPLTGNRTNTTPSLSPLWAPSSALYTSGSYDDGTPANRSNNDHLWQNYHHPPFHSHMPYSPVDGCATPQDLFGMPLQSPGSGSRVFPPPDYMLSPPFASTLFSPGSGPTFPSSILKSYARSTPSSSGANSNLQLPFGSHLSSPEDVLSSSPRRRSRSLWHSSGNSPTRLDFIDGEDEVMVAETGPESSPPTHPLRPRRQRKSRK